MSRKFEVIVPYKDGANACITEENLKYTIEQFYTPGIIVKEVPCKIETEERNKKVVREIFNLVNLSSNWNSLALVFSRHIISEHRTLVQNFFRMVKRIISNYAKTGTCDARNEGSLSWAVDVDAIDSFMPEI